MGEHVIKLPDVGEGVAEAELVEWQVKVGDIVKEDQILGAVMTDKATVEVPSPVEGKVIWLGAEVGEVIAVGSPLVRLEVSGEGNVAPGAPAESAADADDAAAPPAAADEEAEPSAEREEAAPAKAPAPKPAARPAAKAPPKAASGGKAPGPRAYAPRREGEKPLASPAVRLRAREAGVDLRQVPGGGPAGRITHEDLDAFFAHGPQAARGGRGLVPLTEVTEVRVVGLRRKIAEKMALSKSRVAHITYVEELDMTALEDLRAELNRSKRPEQPKLTLLPFLMRAMVKAVAEQPNLNAIYDDDAGVIHQHAGVHIGIAAQTPGGLVVPVVRHAEARDLWDCAAEVSRLGDAAKAGTATREELGGSTITITSLGAMGGVATTPVVNYPEVAIVGVNKMAVRPHWNGTDFVPRKMMNLSCSFDHRVIDGWDAAVFVQRLKTLLETPAMIFVEG